MLALVSFFNQELMFMFDGLVDSLVCLNCYDSLNIYKTIVIHLLCVLSL